jgi:CHAT domain-containing protein
MHRLSSLSSRLLLLGLACWLSLCVVRAQDEGREDASFDIESPTSVAARKRALEALTSVADSKRGAGDGVALVRVLNRIGEIQRKLNNPDAALATTREALSLARQSGDTPLLADTLTLSAIAHRSREDNDTAMRLLNEARDLSLRLNYRRGEAQSLTELGTTYYNQSELEKAIDYGEGALQIWRELQDRRGEARTLYNLGAPYMRRGKTREATAVLEEAASIWRQLGNSTEQANTLLELNFLSIRLGQWHQALSLLNEIQPLVTDKEAEPYIAAQIAMSFGEVYEAYGQLEEARHYFAEASVLYRDYARDGSAAVDASSKTARVKARLGDYQGAVWQIEEGLQLAEKIGNRFMTALCHEDLGRVHLLAGRHAEAREALLRAVSRYEQTGNRREWARAQTFLGETEYLQGDRGAAAKSYRSALQVFEKFGDYTNEAVACSALGKFELEQQNFEEAGKYLKRSIALTEQLRENAASKDLRSSFLASVHDRYETYVEWLMQQHAARPAERFDIQAFEASEMGRARSLLDTLRDYQRELRQVADPALLFEEEALQKEEQKLLDRRAQLQSEGESKAAEQVVVELTQVRARRETLEAQINSDARVNNLLRPAPLEFADIQKQITDADTSLLEFSLGTRKSYLWLVTPDGLTSYELPDKKTIEEAAFKLAKLLAGKQPTPGEEAETQSAIVELSRLLFSPVAGKLQSERLIIVPDGVLQYIPFQILNDPADAAQPLVARHELVNAPSASTLVLVQQETRGRAAAPKLLAAFGDPVFSSDYASKASVEKQTRSGAQPESGDAQQRDPVSGVQDTLEPNTITSPLYAKHELNLLRKLAPAGESLIYSGFDATRDHLRKLDLGQYRILHFATHGLLNSKQPELSGLVLSLVDRDGRPLSGFVGLADIYNLRTPVDLVVLSACSTALGEDVRGEGLIGLTRGFMYAGAASVVASLWKVDDEATAELMKRFYANMLQQGMTPAAALRAAQNSIRQEPLWRSPHYWAAFTMQGEYRQVIKPAAVSNAMPTYLKLMLAGTLTLTALMAGMVWRYRLRRGRRTELRAAIRR